MPVALNGLVIYGTHDIATIEQLERCAAAELGARGVLCADGHKGYSMPIGGVVGYRNFVSPSGVGYDISCGNLAVRTNLKSCDVSHIELERLADEIARRISFGIGRVNNEPVDHPVLATIASSPVKEQAKLFQIAQQQLGTVGSGNHYVDVLEDGDGFLWVAVHFGSRGFGHRTASMFMNLAQGLPMTDRAHEGEMDAPPLLLNDGTPSGQDYIDAMRIAGEYAYAGREIVVQKVLEIMGAHATYEVHNHHNFTWREQHNGEWLWVVRKGATPIFPGQRGFVGGSMGDMSVVIEGHDSPEASAALYSAMHGAGRLMSRTKAAGKAKYIHRWRCQNYRKCDYTAAKGGYHKDENGPTPTCPLCGHKLHLETMKQIMKPGVVDWTKVRTELAARGIVLRGGGADEAPEVYRPLAGVIAEHSNTLHVAVAMQPKIIVMAGDEVFDPYKD